MNYRIDRLGPLLQDASRKLWTRFEQRTASHGLSAAQWRLLGHLLRNGPSTQSALAALLEVEPISVSRLLDRMEQGGWLHREPHPNDRRARIVMASEKARQTGPQAKQIVEQVYDEALAGLTDDDRRIVQAALVRIIENLKASDPSEGLATASPSLETVK
ncbi:MAG: MarR family transcriptional regulator [Rhodobacterales bacterium]|nr:MarR family transcriptional regulator [Rhodobacterales bacterium]